MSTVLDQHLHAATVRAFQFFVVVHEPDPDTDTRALYLLHQMPHTFTYWLRFLGNKDQLRSVWTAFGATVFQRDDEVEANTPSAPSMYVVRVRHVADLERALNNDQGRLAQALARLPTARFVLPKWHVEVERADFCHARLHPTAAAATTKADTKADTKAETKAAMKAATADFTVRPVNRVWRSANVPPVVRVWVDHEVQPASTGFVVVNGWHNVADRQLVDRWQTVAALLLTHPNVLNRTLVPVVCPACLPPYALEWWGMHQLLACLPLRPVLCAVWLTHRPLTQADETLAVNTALAAPMVGWLPLHRQQQQDGWVMTRRAFAQCVHAWRERVNCEMSKKNCPIASVRTDVCARIRFF